MHDDSGCGYYRIKMPLRELAAHGHDVHLELGEKVQARTAADWPLIVGQRIDKRDALPSWRRLRATSKLVYEIDDDIFSVEQVNWQAYSIYSSPRVADAIGHAAEVANLVTVTNEHLAQVMRQFNENIAILPNYVPGWVLDLPREGGGRPVAGWQGGASHGRDIGELARPLRVFLDRFPGWDAVLLGTDYRPTIRAPQDRCLFRPWIKIGDDAEAYYRALDFGIGLAPLVPTVFAKSKSYVKPLEYAARGIPCIASDVTPYSEFILHGVTGFLVRYDHEWLKYLSELASDAQLRADMGAKAREHARAFTIDRNWQKWEAAYGGL
jgi:hypothetical protein